MGVKNFLNKLKKASADAIIVPNIPIEEADELIIEGRKRGVDVILQVAPTTTEDRLKKISDVASGFLYIVNVEGVTGVRRRVLDSTIKLVKRVKTHTDIPLLAGFGISTKEHTEAIIKAGADGAIVGSAYAKIYEKNLNNPFATLSKIEQLTRELKKGCKNGYRAK
jgi:tryptophan synthase alpha chain